MERHHLDQGEPVHILVGGTESGYANADAVAFTQAGSWSPEMPRSLAPAGAIVLDNADRHFSIKAGDWGTDDDDNAYGADFRYASPDCVSCQARFEVNSLREGDLCCAHCHSGDVSLVSGKAYHVKSMEAL